MLAFTYQADVGSVYERYKKNLKTFNGLLNGARLGISETILLHEHLLRFAQSKRAKIVMVV